METWYEEILECSHNGLENHLYHRFIPHSMPMHPHEPIHNCILSDSTKSHCSAHNNPEVIRKFGLMTYCALQVDTSTEGTQWGTGGMATKLTAARIATAAGCSTVICLASEPERMLGVMAGERVGTVFRPHVNALRLVEESRAWDRDSHLRAC